MSLQKTIFHIHLKNDNQRKNAMKIIASFHGMISTKIGGDGMEVEATGIGVDWVSLAMKLRRKVGFATIVRLGEVKEEKLKEVKKETTSSSVMNHNYYCHYCHCMGPRYYN